VQPGLCKPLKSNRNIDVRKAYSAEAIYTLVTHVLLGKVK
jgi:hypothetical protein